MNEKIEDIVIENQQMLLKLTARVNSITKRDRHVKEEIEKHKKKIKAYFEQFNRDNYKDIDKMLKLTSLATELSIYKKMGFPISLDEHNVILGISEMLACRTEEALKYFENYMEETVETRSKLYCDVLYLCGMIYYNKGQGNFNNAIDYFSRSAELYYKLHERHDFQAKIYVGECMFLDKQDIKRIENCFETIQQELNINKANIEQKELEKYFLTLNLKWGNCYFSSVLKPSKNEIGIIDIDNKRALEYYRKLFDYIGAYSKEKLDDTVKVIMAYSLAQAMYSSKEVDFRFPRGLDGLFLDVFDKLKNFVLNKTEAVILAQFYFMLGTCAWYCSQISADQGLLYFEYARKQTQLIPSSTKFYSSMTKQMLARDEFIREIDLCIEKVKSRMR